MTKTWQRFLPWCVVAISVLAASGAYADKKSDIKSTKHNLSSTSSNAVRADASQANVKLTAGAKEICVFCHTPHGATLEDASGTALTAPLWNRRVKNTSYTGYTSSTLDAESVDTGYTGNPAGSSKLCLSCHDGTVAIGNIGVMSGVGYNLSGSGGVDTGNEVSVNGATSTTMPDGKVSSTVTLATGSGYTRNLSTNLSNDHPISVSYTTDLTTADGEMRTSASDGTANTVRLTSTAALAGTLSVPNNGWQKQNFTDVVARRNIAGAKPLLPLEPTGGSGAGQVQCASCHDPHLGDTDPNTMRYNKFLRGSRFQKTTPAGGLYDVKNDIICLACHDKAGTVWSASVHANSTDANESYKNETGSSTTTNYNAVGTRDLPTNTAVWETACLSCHDVHAVQGTRRLMREGVAGAYSTTAVSGSINPATGIADTSRDGVYRYKTSGVAAGEETCFMCHRARADVDIALNLSTQTVPDIKSDFDLWTTARNTTYTGASSMPIRTSGTSGVETCKTTGTTGEPHTIGDVSTAGVAEALAGKDFVESAANLGKLGDGVTQTCNDSNLRHVECTDCHNPHRVKKGNHAATNGGTDIRGLTTGNTVSNVLTGTFGVEPVWPSDNTGAGSQFGKIPTFDSNSLRCGVAGQTNYCAGGVVQYEYQICMKCHSNYAFDDKDDPIDSTDGGQYNYVGRPEMGKGSATPTGLAKFQGGNGVNVFPAGSRYTNQAMEFWGPTGHRGEQAATVTHTLTGRYAEPNHRSWHPVAFPTGRTASERGMSATGNFRAPFDANVGTQTMYCTDCHGSDSSAQDNLPPLYTTTGDTAIRRPWGPHGSRNPFILKGQYNVGAFDLCLKCHKGFSASDTGFYSSDKGNLHTYHPGRMSGIRCNNCHIAVPHGWKNKALLADTNAVGNEVGFASDGARSFTNAVGYTKGPYYMNSMLKVSTWKRSRGWGSSDCNGGVGGMKSSCQNE